MKDLRHIKEFVNYPIHRHDDSILELARINDKKEFNYDVFVKGSSSYGTGQKEHGEPHFHFSDNIKNPNKFDYSILIPTQKEWEQNKELYIVESMNGDYSWSGKRKIKKELIEWLDKDNIHTKKLTNLEMIILQWNILNTDNKNVRQLPLNVNNSL